MLANRWQICSINGAEKPHFSINLNNILLYYPTTESSGAKPFVNYIFFKIHKYIYPSIKPQTNMNPFLKDFSRWFLLMLMFLMYLKIRKSFFRFLRTSNTAQLRVCSPESRSTYSQPYILPARISWKINCILIKTKVCSSIYKSDRLCVLMLKVL